jgi:hypothetical protein
VIRQYAAGGARRGGARRRRHRVVLRIVGRSRANGGARGVVPTVPPWPATDAGLHPRRNTAP